MNLAFQSILIDQPALAIPEIRCDTKVKTARCRYTWAIEDYKTVRAKQCVLQSAPFSATHNTCNWILELHAKDLSCDTVKLLLKAKSIDELRKYSPISSTMKLSILDSKGRAKCSNANNFLVTAENPSHSVCMYFPELANKNFLPNNILTIRCDFTFTMYDTKLEVPGYDCGPAPASSQTDGPNLLKKFEKLYINEEYSDITILINGKQYPAHRTVLVARSPVFAAMLKHNTEESNSKCIEIKDIDEKIFLEALRYIYTGKVQDLETLSFELLPVAVKYDLKNLRTMCEDVLYSKMSVDTVVKILVLADMHNQLTLKCRAMCFIKTFSVDVVNLMNVEGWSDLTSRPHLMKELLQMFMKK